MTKVRLISHSSICIFYGRSECIEKSTDSAQHSCAAGITAGIQLTSVCIPEMFDQIKARSHKKKKTSAEQK